MRAPAQRFRPEYVSALLQASAEPWCGVWLSGPRDCPHHVLTKTVLAADRVRIAARRNLIIEPEIVQRSDVGEVYSLTASQLSDKALDVVDRRLHESAERSLGELHRYGIAAQDTAWVPLDAAIPPEQIRGYRSILHGPRGAEIIGREDFLERESHDRTWFERDTGVLFQSEEWKIIIETAELAGTLLIVAGSADVDQVLRAYRS